MAGRPKGTPKTGGRKAGVANKITRGFREAQAELQKLFDSALQDGYSAKVYEEIEVRGRKMRRWTGERAPTGKSNLMAFIEAQIVGAIEGDSTAAAVVMDRWAGKPQQHIKVDDEDDAVLFSLGAIAQQALAEKKTKASVTSSGDPIN
jgi:hypothetical protein